MEKYLYKIIFVQIIVILLLYVYLFFRKLKNNYLNNKKSLYEKEIVPYIDTILLKDSIESVDKKEIENIRKLFKDKIKRKVVIDRIIYYNTIFKGEIRNNIVILCEKAGFVDYEIKKLNQKRALDLALSCKILGEFRSPKACDALLKLTGNKNLDIRYHALAALGKIGDINAFVKVFEESEHEEILSERSLIEVINGFEGDKNKLLSKMIKSKDKRLSTLFIKSAGSYMNSKLNEDIAKFIDDDNKDRRVSAIKAIGQNADGRYVDELVKALKDKEWEVRAASAKSLGFIGDARALTPLIEALSDKQWWVRFNAANSIMLIPQGIRSIGLVLKGTDKFAKDILISALENSGLMTEVFILEHLNDTDMREVAALIRNYMNHNIL